MVMCGSVYKQFDNIDTNNNNFLYFIIGIVSDLFPLMEQQDIDYGALEKSIRDVILHFGLDDVNGKQKPLAPN